MNAPKDTSSPSSTAARADAGNRGAGIGRCDHRLSTSQHCPRLRRTKPASCARPCSRCFPASARCRRSFIGTANSSWWKNPTRTSLSSTGAMTNRANLWATRCRRAGPGFQDTIAILYGYKPGEKIVVGMEVLESRETPGLGDKIYKDAVFVAGFSALSVEPEIFAVKKGTKSQPNEIDAITGATISSKAVVRIINEAHAAWSAQLAGTGFRAAAQSNRASEREAEQ